jgi:hypothetical protein
MKFSPVIFLIFLLGVILFFSCKTTISGSYLLEDQVKVEEPAEGIGNRKSACHDYLNYAPDTNHLEFTPVKYVRVNFHFMNSTDSSQNYTGQKAIDFANTILQGANYMFNNNKKSYLPRNNDIPVLPVRIQYILTPRENEPDDDGIYFHYDDECYFMVKKGKNSTLTHKTAFERYGVMKDTVLNVFLLPHHPDSVKSPTYGAFLMGIAMGDFVKVAWNFNTTEELDAIQMRGTFNHEVAHIYSLVHAWAYNDGCDDTPLHPLDTLSNNIMDYRSQQLSLTPCQIGKMHWRMSTPRATGRKFLEPLWCFRDPNKTIFIKDSIEWMTQKDLEGDLVITEGAQLRIGCRISIPKDGRITVEPGAKLILENAQLHNDCGDKWQGIEIQKSKKGVGEVISIGKVKIEDVEYPLNRDASGEIPRTFKKKSS